MTRNEIKHSMVIVEDTNGGGGGGGGTRGKVVGFLEIGMLPKPSSSEESALDGEALTAARAAAALAGAAGAKSRGRTVGGSEARLGTGAGGERGSGEGANKAKGRKEEEEEDGGGGSEGGVGDGESRRSSTTAIRREKRPDVAYLANVVVDRRQRRRGIGRTMVSSAVEIVKELWPAEEKLYVSVEQARTRGRQAEGGGRWEKGCIPIM